MHERDRSRQRARLRRGRGSESAKEETGEKRRGRDVLISFSVTHSEGTALPNSTSAKQIYPRHRELTKVSLWVCF